MARAQSQGPALTKGNVIYLYGLLAREIGYGKQTFLPRVEEALLAESMTAEDLGFENTRALLEALGDCVNLTVFKGGRIYATVISQPAWDEALAAPVESKADAAAKSGRPWKRKKNDKSLKPVKPRRVKREAVEPKPEAKPEPVERDAATQESVEAPDATIPNTEETVAEVEFEAAAEPEPARIAEPIAPIEPEPAVAIEPETTLACESEPKVETVPEPEAEPVAQEPQPSISLTITYDPYSDSSEETALEPSREAIAKTVPQPVPPVEAEPATVQAVEVASPSAPSAPTPSPEALANYPHDFTHEVYCSTEHLAELNQLLPLGTATMPLLAEDFQRALDLELITGTRSRATFPLRVQRLDATEPIKVTIRKQSGPGLPWVISHVE